MNQIIKAGDFVRLLKSNNPYVPVGTILEVESITKKTPLVFTVCVVKRKWSKYFVHGDIIRKVKFMVPERVEFT
jgi:hypothetical protein